MVFNIDLGAVHRIGEVLESNKLNAFSADLQVCITIIHVEEPEMTLRKPVGAKILFNGIMGQSDKSGTGAGVYEHQAPAQCN